MVWKIIPCILIIALCFTVAFYIDINDKLTKEVKELKHDLAHFKEYSPINQAIISTLAAGGGAVYIPKGNYDSNWFPIGVPLRLDTTNIIEEINNGSTKR